MIYSFEKLRVWQKSKHLVKFVYRITSKFPNEEKYGLTSQLRRAAVSVSSNIAEGSARKSQKEKRRFYNIAYGSLIEVLNQLLIAQELDYLNGEKIKIIRSNISEISWMLTSLYKTTGDEIETVQLSVSC